MNSLNFRWMGQMVKKGFSLFASARTAVFLIFLLILQLAIRSFQDAQALNSPNPIFQRFGQGLSYQSIFFYGLLALIGVSVVAGTFKRYPFKKHHVGFICVHIGIIVILIGSFISHWRGVEGEMKIREGGEWDSFIRFNQKKIIREMRNGTLDPTRMPPFTPLPLGFTLRLLKISAPRYPGSDLVKDYLSTVEILDHDAQGRPIHWQAVIHMNHPLVYKGFRIYQANYEEGRPAISTFSVRKDPGIPVVYTGYGIFIAGLILLFYIKKYLKKKPAVFLAAAPAWAEEVQPQSDIPMRKPEPPEVVPRERVVGVPEGRGGL